MSLTTIGMWETRRRKNPSLWQIGCSMCTTGISDLLAAKGLILILKNFFFILYQFSQIGVRGGGGIMPLYLPCLHCIVLYVFSKLPYIFALDFLVLNTMHYRLKKKIILINVSHRHCCSITILRKNYGCCHITL